MASPPPSRLLRIAVMQEGSFSVIDERVFARPADITAGEDARNTFVVPAADLPPRFTVFEYKAPHYRLVFGPGMRGRVALDGPEHHTLEALRSSGRAQPRGEVHVLELPASARGVLQLGEVSFIFNFVTPLPPAPAEELPRGVRGGAWRTVDRVFFTVLVISLLVHLTGATAIALSERPVERELALDELPDRFARVLVPPRAPEPEKPAEAAAPAGVDEEKQDEEKPREAASEEKKAAEAPPSAEEQAKRRAAIQRKVAGSGLLKVLGSAGGARGPGAFADLIGGGTGTQDIATALSGASGVGVATQGPEGPGGRRGAGSGAVEGIGELATQGGGKVDLGPKREVQVSGSVTSTAPEVDSSDVDRDALARYVKARLKAIQSCYEKELRRNPTLKGKVVVRFSIQPTGRTGDIDIEENSVGNEAVASCIRTVIRGWVFPFKPDDDVPVVYPFVFAPAG